MVPSENYPGRQSRAAYRGKRRHLTTVLIHATALAAVLAVSPKSGAEAAESATSSAAGGTEHPGFSISSREDKLLFFPCGDCHEYLDPDPAIRELDVDPGHPEKLEHGAGEVWCNSCHGPWPYSELHTLLGEPVGYNDSYRVCGGCHSHRLRDWKYGAHGKRVGNWRGERLIYGCPECHNPHRPGIAPRAPLEPPPMRAGLERTDGHAEKQPPVWESHLSEQNND